MWENLGKQLEHAALFKSTLATSLDSFSNPQAGRFFFSDGNQCFRVPQNCGCQDESTNSTVGPAVLPTKNGRGVHWNLKTQSELYRLYNVVYTPNLNGLWLILRQAVVWGYSTFSDTPMSWQVRSFTRGHTVCYTYKAHRSHGDEVESAKLWLIWKKWYLQNFMLNLQYLQYWLIVSRPHGSMVIFHVQVYPFALERLLRGALSTGECPWPVKTLANALAFTVW